MYINEMPVTKRKIKISMPEIKEILEFTQKKCAHIHNQASIINMECKASLIKSQIKISKIIFFFFFFQVPSSIIALKNSIYRVEQTNQVIF